MQVAREKFNISCHQDWSHVKPEWLLNIKGFGNQTLNKLRYAIAEYGITLLGDHHSAEFWQKQGQLERFRAERLKEDGTVLCPFTVVIDSNETLPYQFLSLRDTLKRPIEVKKIRKPLWSMSRREYTIDGVPLMAGLADYSVNGFEENIQIERKSVSDLFGSFGHNRHKMEARFARMNECEIAYIVIEETLEYCRKYPPEHSKVSFTGIEGAMMSWTQKYPGVHWMWCDGRDEAELRTFNLLDKFYKNAMRKYRLELRSEANRAI